jgi:hypothetical protein
MISSKQRASAKFRFLVLALVVGIAVMAVVFFSISSISDATGLRTQFQPVSRWRLGLHRVELCQSSDPSMVGWRANLGFLSVSRLQRWQPTEGSLIISTNPIVVESTNNISE